MLRRSLSLLLGSMPGARGCERTLHGDRGERFRPNEAQKLVFHGQVDYMAELILTYCKMNFKSWSSVSVEPIIVFGIACLPRVASELANKNSLSFFSSILFGILK